MKYSFVLIAYNEQDNIAACIDSIAALDGLDDQYEVIVADDGSRDSTVEIVQAITVQNHHVKLIGDGKNHGRGYGRYLGANAAMGEYVIMVDADIILPKTWLTTALQHIAVYDVVGGIAVPDGDVAFIYRAFKLKPKTVMGTTTITGNNGMYKRSMFAKVAFDKNLCEGEDVDFNHHSKAAGFSSFCIPGLTVEHQEHKSFLRSMQWLYQSGIGATRQLFRFKEIRLPDLAFFATIGSLFLAIVLVYATGVVLGFIVPVLGVLGASLLHIRGKFYLPYNRPLAVVGALATDALLVACYYVGRTVGPFVYIAHKKDATK